MIIINFKNYKHGKEALDLAEKIQKFLPEAIVAVSPSDVGYLTRHMKLKVFAQHIDVVQDEKKATGFLTINAIKSNGAVGSLINHSEHQLSNSQVKESVELLGKNKIFCVVCVRNLLSAKNILKYGPDAIAFEDEKLIASGMSIATCRADDVRKFVELLKGSKVVPICGAGISSAKDIGAAFELGCEGVLIASAIANSDNPKDFLKEVSKLKL